MIDMWWHDVIVKTFMHIISNYAAYLLLSRHAETEQKTWTYLSCSKVKFLKPCFISVLLHFDLLYFNII